MKKYLFIFHIAILILISSVACNSLNSRVKGKEKIKATESEQTYTKNRINTTADTGNKDKIEKNNKVSGETAEVPWINDDSFKKAIQEAGNPVLMAAYRTVLEDPLPGEENNVHLAAKLLAGTSIKPGEVFSQNHKIGPYEESRGFQKGPTYSGTQLTTTIGGGVCKISSTLYNVTVLSNLPVTERHPHCMPVPYVPYGQDATVSYGEKDYKFRNNTPFPIIIWAQGVENILYVGFYGKSKPPKVNWQHKTLEVYKANEVVKVNADLPKGSKKLISKGMDGADVKTWVTIENPDGTVVTKQLGENYYEPMPFIYEINK